MGCLEITAIALDEGRLFGLDYQLLLDATITAVNVFILFLLLSYILFKPLRAMLKKRQDKITSDRETAESNKADAIALKEEYEEKLKAANKEAEAILREARKTAMHNEAKLASTTYGEALFELAVEESKVDLLYDEAKLVIAAFDDNKELGRLLNEPKIDKEEKKEVIKNIFSQSVSDDLMGLLVLMVSKDRQKDIVATLKVFEDKVREYKKIGTAYVTTAKPLSQELKDKLLDKLLKTTDYVSFNMVYNVDESLIAGMVIRIGDRVIDSSIRHKLDELEKELRKIQLA